MKSQVVSLSMVALLLSPIYVLAHGDEDHGSPKGSMQAEEFSPDAINIGNKVCLLSGEVITDVGDGKGVPVEYKGKIYNFCCKMCAKDFKKNPEKFVPKFDELLKKQKAGEEIDQDQALENKGEHEHGGAALKEGEGHDHGAHEHGGHD